MTPNQEALAEKYLNEARAYNEQLGVLLQDNKWNEARMDALLAKLKEGINTQAEWEHLDRERRQIMRRVEINKETKARLDKVNEDLAIKINGLFGRKVW